MPPTTTPALDPDMDTEYARRGATIRTLRTLHGLSAKELGRLVGRSEAGITAIERGERAADLAVCRDIAGALKVPVAAIAIEGYAEIADESPALNKAS